MKNLIISIVLGITAVLFPMSIFYFTIADVSILLALWCFAFVLAYLSIYYRDKYELEKLENDFKRFYSDKPKSKERK
jgi:ABC-type polysaccharide/polyol phosphate export permease